MLHRVSPFYVMLSVTMSRVKILSAVMLSVVILSVVIQSVVLLGVSQLLKSKLREALLKGKDHVGLLNNIGCFVKKGKI